MRKTLFLLLLLCSNFIHAQQFDPVGERFVYFPYAVGERADKKLKILLIGTHLIRFKTIGDQSNVHAPMGLDFGKIIEKVQRDERYFGADYDNVHFLHTQMEYLFGAYPKWLTKVAVDNNLNSGDNSLSAMEKVRAKLIRDYRAKGYKVFQVDYQPNPEAFPKYRDVATDTYKLLPIERVSPLSPLEVSVYRIGEIKDLLSRFDTYRGSYSGPSLTIESSDSKKNDNSSGNKSGGSGSSSHKMTDEEIRIDISFRKTRAEMAAAEGDSYYKLGTLGYAAALQKYQQAQQEYYSSDVQRKIDEINGWMALGKAFNQLAEGIDNMAANVDPKKKTRWIYWGFTYTGLGGSYDKITNNAKQQPMEGLLAFSGHRLCFSFEMRMGYYASPVYEYNITTNSYSGNTETPYKVQTQNDAIGLGLSGGLNIPMKSLVLYAMIGFDARMFNVASKITPSQFSFEEGPEATDFPSFDSRLSFGASYRIPKSKLGFTVQYVMHSIKGETDGATPLKYSANPSGHYYLNRTTDEKYQYNDFSVGITFAIR